MAPKLPATGSKTCAFCRYCCDALRAGEHLGAPPRRIHSCGYHSRQQVLRQARGRKGQTRGLSNAAPNRPRKRLGALEEVVSLSSSSSSSSRSLSESEADADDADVSAQLLAGSGRRVAGPRSSDGALSFLSSDPPRPSAINDLSLVVHLPSSEAHNTSGEESDQGEPEALVSVDYGTEGTDVQVFGCPVVGGTVVIDSSTMEAIQAHGGRGAGVLQRQVHGEWVTVVGGRVPLKQKAKAGPARLALRHVASRQAAPDTRASSAPAVLLPASPELLSWDGAVASLDNLAALGLPSPPTGLFTDFVQPLPYLSLLSDGNGTSWPYQSTPAATSEATWQHSMPTTGAGDGLQSSWPLPWHSVAPADTQQQPQMYSAAPFATSSSAPFAGTSSSAPFAGTSSAAPFAGTSSAAPFAGTSSAAPLATSSAPPWDLNSPAAPTPVELRPPAGTSTRESENAIHSLRPQKDPSAETGLLAPPPAVRASTPSASGSAPEAEEDDDDDEPSSKPSAKPRRGPNVGTLQARLIFAIAHSGKYPPPGDEWSGADICPPWPSFEFKKARSKWKGVDTSPTGEQPKGTETLNEFRVRTNQPDPNRRASKGRPKAKTA